MDNVKLTNIKQNHFSNYFEYKDIFSNNKFSKNNSVDDIINKIYLKKNIKKHFNSKRTLRNKYLRIPILNSKNFSQENIYKEKETERNNKKEQNVIGNLLKKFDKIKDKNQIRNFSFTNNLINSKINQYEENFEFQKDKLIDFSSINRKTKSFFPEKSEGKKIITSYKNNLRKKYNDTFFNKNIINLKGNFNDDQNIIKIKKIRNRGFNKFLNKFISENIINNLKSFNKIGHLIKLNGFTLNSNIMKNFYKDNEIKDEKEIICNKIKTQKMIRIKRLKNLERLVHKNDTPYNSEEKGIFKIKIRKIGRNKISSLINSEMKENKNNLGNITILSSNKTEFKSFKLYNKEIAIKRKVNRFYKDKNYKSFKEFYNDIKKNNNYLTINNIEFFLNKIIKVSFPLSREEINEIFFNNLKEKKLDYYNFKNFFKPFNEPNKNDNSSFNEEKQISNEELIKIENEIYLKIVECKDILLNKLEEKKGINSHKNNYKYLLDYQEFYNLIEENLIIEKNKYFEPVIKRIFKKYSNLVTKKINILNFLYKDKSKTNEKNFVRLENKNNNSELVNEFSNNDEKKKFQGINLKNNSKIKLKNKILGTEEISNNIGKKISRYRNLKKEIINDFNNSARINYINNITKSKNFIFDSENNKKNKNSDIINLI